MILRFLRQAFLLSYIFLTFCALSYTLARKHIPYVEWPFVTHFYAMMAPFQRYTTQNAELMIYAKYPNGSWITIDRTLYFPFSRGEYAVRMRLSALQQKEAAYTEMARFIYEDQKRQNKPVTAVRLQWEQWEKSPYDYYGNYAPETVTTVVITQYPNR